MIDTVHCKEYFDKVVASAKEIGKYESGQDSLKKRLDYLDTYADSEKQGLTKCVLGKDFAPLSFAFSMYRRNGAGEWDYWFSGGLIFHGTHDNGGRGEGPSYAVCVESCDGWSVHT